MKNILRLIIILACLSAATSGAKNSINVEITSHLGDEKVFYAGDTINFLVSTDRSAYLLMIYETADGKLIQIFPNRFASQKRYKADSYFPIPDADSGFQFVISEPFGKEKVWIFASDKKFPDFKGRWLGNGSKLLGGKKTFTLRNIKKRSLGNHTFNLTTRASP